MGWQAFTVESRTEGDRVAEALLAVANDSATWSLANFGAMVIRLQLEDGERFYFSPHAAGVFQELLARHHADPCNPPLARTLSPPKTSRLVLGFKTRWESFMPPKPAKSEGVPGSGGRGGP